MQTATALQGNNCCFGCGCSCANNGYPCPTHSLALAHGHKHVIMRVAANTAPQTHPSQDATHIHWTVSKPHRPTPLDTATCLCVFIQISARLQGFGQNSQPSHPCIATLPHQPPLTTPSHTHRPQCPCLRAEPSCLALPGSPHRSRAGCPSRRPPPAAAALLRQSPGTGHRSHRVLTGTGRTGCAAC